MIVEHTKELNITKVHASMWNGQTLYSLMSKEDGIL